MDFRHGGACGCLRAAQKPNLGCLLAVQPSMAPMHMGSPYPALIWQLGGFAVPAVPHGLIIAVL